MKNTVFNKFRLKILIRIALLVATIGLFFALMQFHSSLFFSAILTGLVVVVQIAELIYFIDRTNKLLSDFLLSIRYSDFTRHFQVETTNSSLDRLKKTFNDVIKNFQSVRIEREESHYYLQTVIQHIGIALIAYQKDGQVELINDATKKMFRILNLPNIHALNDLYPELVQILLNIGHGENALLKISKNSEELQLSIYGTGFKIQNRSILLVSIQNIRHELDEKEMESWQKLIRVLTHEIMNSITPILSLSSTVRLLMNSILETAEQDAQSEKVENIAEIKEALATIQNRAEGLIHFVNTYRNLTQIPMPSISTFSVLQLLHNVYDLYRNEMSEAGIACMVNVEPDFMELSADKKLIEQVLINLVRNAIHAMQNETKNPLLELRAYLNKHGKVTIQVTDNGQGILPEVVERIFIPFFTTKPQGSGIGLSLSRQILRLHGGNISVRSEPEKETEFTLTF
ncbi:MAG: ATP-binding protein [Cytophagaceae bacterium]|nr:ATP-binding protein [Cytophagaceae bacterium]